MQASKPTTGVAPGQAPWAPKPMPDVRDMDNFHKIASGNWLVDRLLKIAASGGKAK